jgi:hypothetical protein
MTKAAVTMTFLVEDDPESAARVIEAASTAVDGLTRGRAERVAYTISKLQEIDTSQGPPPWMMN